MFDLIDTTKTPDFVNAEGVKWWTDTETTRYAVRKGFDLASIRVYLVEKPDGYKTRLIIKDNEIVYEHQGLENVLCRIDIMALDRDMPE